MDIVVWFADLRRSDTAVAGGKGANLGELVAAGFPVPPGFVVTAPAYLASMQAAHVRDELAAASVAPPSPEDAAELAYRLRPVTPP